MTYRSDLKWSFRRMIKGVLSKGLRLFFKGARVPLRLCQRVCNHAFLSAHIQAALDPSVIVLGRPAILGTGKIIIGKNTLIYPGVCLETRGAGEIFIGDDVVLSTGTHIVSFGNISIGQGALIGEYSSIRDQNHYYGRGVKIRESGYDVCPISIGPQVWVGRGVCILKGVKIGEGAVIGANAVVTHDVLAFSTVAGIPARILTSEMGTAE
ncbi:MAG: acyltransferase [Lentisphaerota bacterium]